MSELGDLLREAAARTREHKATCSRVHYGDTPGRELCGWDTWAACKALGPTRWQTAWYGLNNLVVHTETHLEMAAMMADARAAE